MKFLYFLIIVVSFQKTDSFFGFNVVYPTFSKISSECVKAASNLISLPSKLDQISKVSSKFSSKEYSLFTESIMDLRLFFDGLHVFLQQYSDFINEPPTSNPLKIIALLQYSAQLMESATDQVGSAPKNFGFIFGQNLESATDLLIGKYTEGMRNIRLALEIFYLNFKSILNAGIDVTVEILDGEINQHAIADTLVAFQEISIASKQMTSIISSALSILQTLDAISSRITETECSIQSSITSLKYSINLEIKSAKSIFNDQVRINIDKIIESFGNYSQTSHNVFFNTTSHDFLNSLQAQQKILDNFGSQTSEMLWQIQTVFAKRLQIYYEISHKSIKSGFEIISTAVAELKNYLSKLIIRHGGSNFKDCFGKSNELEQHVLFLLSKIEYEFIECINGERSLSLEIGRLMAFIVEDVTINIQGAFDNLCRCSVTGGTSILNLTEECIENIVIDLSTDTFKEDEMYLNYELDQASETLEKSEIRLENCIKDLKKSHDKAFAKFQQASLTCIVSQ